MGPRLVPDRRRQQHDRPLRLLRRSGGRQCVYTSCGQIKLVCMQERLLVLSHQRHQRETMRSTRDMLKLDSCIRTLRTSAIIRQASPSSKPPPMAYNIFDREAKRLQRSRAALRRPVNTSGSAYEDMSRRGEVSRLTDYVRDIGAMNLAERLLVRI